MKSFKDNITTCFSTIKGKIGSEIVENLVLFDKHFNGLKDSTDLMRLTFWLLLTVYTVALFIFPIASYFQLLNFFDDSPAIWFQRSGSILVLSGVIVELFGDKMNFLFSKEFMDAKEQLYAKASVTFISLGYVGWGSLIWGYGDLIYQAING